MCKESTTLSLCMLIKRQNLHSSHNCFYSRVLKLITTSFQVPEKSSWLLANQKCVPVDSTYSALYDSKSVWITFEGERRR